ncbi:MAG: A/G-specific adenine glycosylase [Magnetococcus sp. YQC-9]
MPHPLPDEATRRRLVTRLLEHYAQHGRDLPWRHGSDPYPIWVAEIMLQQTGVWTVLPYYERFLERFPTVAQLAEAPLEAVLSLWQGLGYYRRASHLHAAAQRVMREHQGRFPDTFDALKQLPGIGESTAGAILAIAHGQHHAILDGNVKRVLARLLALEIPTDSTPGKKRLWECARLLTPRDQAGHYAQAIMDLGATICKPTRPLCHACPWNEGCAACKNGHPEAHPVPKPRAPKPRKYQFQTLVVRPEGRVLMLPKAAGGLLGGLWHPPGDEPGPSASPPNAEAVQAHLKERFGIAVELPIRLPEVEHTFTHFHLTVFPFLGAWLSGEPPVETGYRWFDWREDTALPIATLHRKVLKRLS